jgi:hypothetical protein
MHSCRFLFGKPEEKTPFGTARRHRGKDNIEVDLKGSTVCVKMHLWYLVSMESMTACFDGIYYGFLGFLFYYLKSFSKNFFLVFHAVVCHRFIMPPVHIVGSDYS